MRFILGIHSSYQDGFIEACELNFPSLVSFKITENGKTYEVAIEKQDLIKLGKALECSENE